MIPNPNMILDVSVNLFRDKKRFRLKIGNTPKKIFNIILTYMRLT